MAKYKNRTLEKYLKNIIGKFPVIMISGARQVGKTTLLNYLTTNNKDINYVTMDNKLLLAQAKEDPELFLRTHEVPLVIDEFQYAAELLPYIKMRVDEARKNAMFGNIEEVGTLYYLTGSQDFLAMEEVGESLAGRIAILDLYGLSLRELEEKEEPIFIPDIKLLKQKEKTSTMSTKKLFEQILNGGYPELNLNKNMDRDIYYQSYIRTYMERDVRMLLNIKDEEKFLKFISCVAARTAQEYNVSDLASDIEVDTKTIESWMSILKNTHLVYMLQAYSNNNVQKAIKRPKMYFMDTGLACYLSGYFNAETLEKSAYNGAIFETFIISEIIKSYANNGKTTRGKLYYYRDKNGKEIDLLVINDNKVYPVEIKKSANPGVKAIKNFEVVKKFGLDIGNGCVLCMMQDIMAIDNNYYYVPIEYV